ncbi:unnamed protein product [Soboliphyme baturini]|uniref:Fer2_2 domain-containing protein n=1 Tax=Soboliphyme baturini TaxID=241478 RepID=A0A183IEL3_9BILA|nr:unnamed protein product [Soboliphyme baturini]
MAFVLADYGLNLGNLCRCTGYRPILEACYSFAVGCTDGRHCSFMKNERLVRMRSVSFHLMFSMFVFQGIDIKFRNAHFPFFISTLGVAELKRLELHAKKGLFIGATVSLSQLKEELLDLVRFVPGELRLSIMQRKESLKAQGDKCFHNVSVFAKTMIIFRVSIKLGLHQDM